MLALTLPEQRDLHLLNRESWNRQNEDHQRAFMAD